MADPRLYDMLKNPDAAKRKAAIQALARAKDPDAIVYLERVADNDNDSSIRDLAEKAIVYINRNNPDNTVAPEVETPRQLISSTALYDDEPLERDRFVQVSPAEEERARRLLGTALDLNMRNQNTKAIKAAIDAFKANPNLKDDAYARGIASTVTGLNVSEAVEKIIDGSAIELFEPKKAVKAKRGGGGSGGLIGDLPTRDSDGREAGEETEISFGSAMLDLLIYGLVNAVVIGGALFLLLYFVIDAIPGSMFNQQITQGAPLTYGELVNLFKSVGVPLLLLYSAMYGVFQMIAMFAQAGAIHWAATSFMKGEGTFSELLHRMSVFYTFITPLVLILPAIGGFIAGSMSASVSQAVVDGQSIGSIVNLGVSIYAIWGSSVRIGRTYGFGTGNGCLSLFVGSIFLGVLCCVMIFGFSYLVGSGLTGLMQ
jgi:hypothetical protein